MILTNNIDIVRIPINKEKIKYFPVNTNFKDKKIGRIFVNIWVGFQNRNIQDPFTGKKIISYTEYKNILITLKNTAGETIYNNVPLSLFLSNQKCTKCIINDYIDWENSYINLLNATLFSSTDEIMLYVTYEDTYTDKIDIKNTKIIEIPPDIFNQNLSDFINNNDLGQLVKIQLSNANNYADNLYLTIHDKKGRTFETINALLFLELDYYIESLSYGFPKNRMNDPILFNNISIDWEKSKVYNFSKTDTYPLTLYFA